MAPLGPAVTFSSFSPASLAAPTGRASDGSPLASFDVLASHSNENTPSNDVATGSAHPEYIAYFLIPVFFLMGLLGIFICHILKKKGYRCTTEAEQEEEKLEEKIELNDSTNDNGDTVGKIVDYIMKNEANADVLKAMVADNSVYDPESPTSPTTPGSPTSPISPLSSGGPQSKHTCRGRHLHTVGGIAGTGACTRCSQKRWHLFSPAKKSKDARKARHGEVTVLSVGRFRVTKVEHKSASKERRNLMSVSSGEGVNGEMPATPVKEGSKEAPVTPAIKQSSKQLQSTPAEQGSRVRTDAD